MKILYVADRNDPRDHDAGSGRDYLIYHGLEDAGYQLELAGPFLHLPTLSERAAHRIHRILFSKRPSKYHTSYLRYTSQQIESAIEKTQPDVIITKRALTMAFSNFDIPLVSLMDTTLKGNQDQWPMFSSWAFRRMLAWETRGIQKSAQILTNSAWSAGYLRDYYQVPETRISIYANVASLPEEVIPKEIFPEKRTLTPIKILLVGKEFHRKGIDIAIEVIHRLNNRGFLAELRIVGLDGQNEDHVRYMGLFRKTDPDELEAYVENYHWADFLIHPARFEAAGIVPSEAAAFGVPTITNDAGGLGTTVKDGVSGIVLTKDSLPVKYLDTIIGLVEDHDRYLLLCRSARARYESELNWRYERDQIIAALERAVAESKGSKT